MALGVFAKQKSYNTKPKQSKMGKILSTASMISGSLAPLLNFIPTAGPMIAAGMGGASKLLQYAGDNWA